MINRLSCDGSRFTSSSCVNAPMEESLEAAAVGTGRVFSCDEPVACDVDPNSILTFGIGGLNSTKAGLRSPLVETTFPVITVQFGISRFRNASDPTTVNASGLRVPSITKHNFLCTFVPCVNNLASVENMNGHPQFTADGKYNNNFESGQMVLRMYIKDGVKSTTCFKRISYDFATSFHS